MGGGFVANLRSRGQPPLLYKLFDEFGEGGKGDGFLGIIAEAANDDGVVAGLAFAHEEDVAGTGAFCGVELVGHAGGVEEMCGGNTGAAEDVNDLEAVEFGAPAEMDEICARCDGGCGRGCRESRIGRWRSRGGR